MIYLITESSPALIKEIENIFPVNSEFNSSYKLIFDTEWNRFGKYDHYLIIDNNNSAELIKGHAGEIVPGSTEDLVDFFNKMNWETEVPNAPMTLELDTTYSCLSKNCGGYCFSYPYRKKNLNASISDPILKSITLDFAQNGGRIVRFDGGGEPFLCPSLADGSLINFASNLNLKTTLLTSGEPLVKQQINLNQISQSGCYLRFSLNASTDEVRNKFHRNTIKLSSIFKAIENYGLINSKNQRNTPIGATFLLGNLNFKEILSCAIMSKNIGINHFSIRRVLGTTSIRPHFNELEKELIYEQFEKIKMLGDDNFKVFIPWRDLDEEDLNASAFNVERCWQSTVKTVIEPNPNKNGFARIQLCGRCRGNEINSPLPPIDENTNSGEWVSKWRESFQDYPFTRPELLNQCNSCIDFGFINLFDKLSKYKYNDVRMVHLKLQ